jgi:hypothetical protein
MTNEKEKDKNKNKETKKEIKDDKNKNNNKKDTQEKKTTVKKFASTKEALKEIDRELLIQKHKTTGVSYWRCGRNNHYTTECYAKTGESRESLQKPKVTSQSQRKRNDDERRAGG